MKIVVSIDLGGVSVSTSGDQEDISQLIRTLREAKEDLVSLIGVVRELRSSGQDNRANTASEPSRPSGSGEMERIADRSQTDQMLALLFLAFKQNPDSATSPSDLAAAFVENRFVRPANPSSLLRRAVRRGLVSSAGGADGGLYRLTVQGRRRATEVLSGE